MRSWWAAALLACGAPRPLPPPPPTEPNCEEQWIAVPLEVEFAPGSAELVASEQARLEDVMRPHCRSDVRRIRVEAAADVCASPEERGIFGAREAAVAASLIEMGHPRAMIEGRGFDGGYLPCGNSVRLMLMICRSL